ncbi:MAG TPA: protoporphyrinogen oxidase [Pirellulaceae bacterium]|jgi:oxygen-dependent protoporphyrinogen oxidase|nr:protoporphyrinogen oxidase [Pirellulaceae bacterium]
MSPLASERDPRSPRVAILGGGISGLAAAFELQKANDQTPAEAIAYDLLEAGDELGGILQTEQRDGFVIERAADMFSVREPWARDLCRDLGLESDLLGTNERYRRAFVVRRGKLHPVPEGFTLLAPSKWWPIAKSPLLNVPGKLRMAAERFVRRRDSDEDESLASFSRRRFGSEAYERLIQPLIGGIYTADPEKLSMLATLPQFVEMERSHGSIVAATLAKPKTPAGREGTAESGARYGGFVAPKGGMRELIQRIAAALPAEAVHRRTAVAAVTQDDDGAWTIELADGRRETYDAVVLATPSHVAAKLLAEAKPELSSALNQITHASAAIVVAGYRKSQIARPLDGFGLVVPHVERRKILAGSFASVKFPGRAPDDAVLTRTFVGGALQPELLERDDAEIAELVRRELAELLGVQGEPLFAEVVRWNRTMPQYHVGHLDRVAAIERLVEQSPGLAVAGNAYRGVGIPFCIRSGQQAASRVRDAALARKRAGSEVS